MNFVTEQERFWAGDFGDQYIDRNSSPELIAGNTVLFAKILASTRGVHSILELGANIGLNLAALRWLLPNAHLSAVEINPKAAEILRQRGDIEVHQGSILEYRPSNSYDFVLTSGVLIHIDPDHLPAVYDLMYTASHHYICISEYYNPTPVTITYRGHDNKLFKRDFAGELIDRHPDLVVVDYGFVWRRDPNFALGDTNWFLLEKRPV